MFILRNTCMALPKIYFVYISISLHFQGKIANVNDTNTPCIVFSLPEEVGVLADALKIFKVKTRLFSLSYNDENNENKNKYCLIRINVI